MVYSITLASGEAQVTELAVEWEEKASPGSSGGVGAGSLREDPDLSAQFFMFVGGFRKKTSLEKTSPEKTKLPVDDEELCYF